MDREARSVITQLDSEFEYGVSEIFGPTLQGEGSSTGVPVHFIRLQGCLVGCRWCDSKYTWDHKGGGRLPVYRILDQLSNLGGKCKLVVISGGEPLEQDCRPLIRCLVNRDFRVEIETSGECCPPRPGEFEHPERIQFNLSPKLEHAQAVKDTWQNVHHFQKVWFNQMIFKFVVDTESDVEEVLRRVHQYEIGSSKVWLMPQGLTPDDLKMRSTWLADRCKILGFNFTTRLHILLWGPKRGH